MSLRSCVATAIICAAVSSTDSYSSQHGFVPHVPIGKIELNRSSDTFNNQVAQRKFEKGVFWREIKVDQTKELPRLAADRTPAVIAGEPRNPVRLYERVAPAVTLVKMWVRVTVEFPEPTMNMQKWSETLGQITALIEQNKLSATSWEVATFLLDDIQSDVQKYVNVGDKLISSVVTDRSEGSGFIVTPDGWLVTNAHVILPEDEEQKYILTGELSSRLSLQTLDSWIQAKFPNIYNLVNPRLNVIHDALVESVFNKIRKDVYYGKIDRKCFVWVINYRSNDTPEKTNWPARLVAYGESSPGRDVAILKIDGGVFPFLALGDDSRLAPGDIIFLMGYPGGGTFNETLLNTRIAPLVATLTKGIVSALKPSKNNQWRWIQTDAAVYHGSSGGPAFDSTGAVVGIATMISRGKTVQEIMPGMNFCLPISIAKKMLEELNVAFTDHRYSSPK